MSTHLEIAKERFLDMMAGEAGRRHPAAEVAEEAIRQADAFMRVYRDPDEDAKSAGPTRGAKTKGCRACHGSGGKMLDPCTVCKGTGRVKA